VSDLTESQRVERAHHAKRALEEFLDPAFAVVQAEYEARLKAICASKPWATNEIAALANASRIVTEVRGQVISLVYDGESARQGQRRAEAVEKMSPAKRRLLDIGPWR
jgi:hypothetical protein